jgi:hypothetical protein
MARPRVRLSSAGAADVLRSAGAHALVRAAVDRIAEDVRSQNIMVEGIPGDVTLPVETSVDTTDRAHGRVTIAHAAGQAVQAKHGALTKAADSIGADVKIK